MRKKIWAHTQGLSVGEGNSQSLFMDKASEVKPAIHIMIAVCVFVCVNTLYKCNLFASFSDPLNSWWFLNVTPSFSWPCRQLYRLFTFTVSIRWGDKTDAAPRVYLCHFPVLKVIFLAWTYKHLSKHFGKGSGSKWRTPGSLCAPIGGSGRYWFLVKH